jgi:hypothetical protein
MALSFADGYVGQLDLGAALGESDPLRDPVFFAQGSCNGLTVEWPGGIDFCPDTLRTWCESGKVLSPEETDRYLGRVFGSFGFRAA